ncbi:hypothetical protein AGMMS50229_07210 [Campylobacterota bacterium]|nr:hypothetical protein AGMMS50229_07210 [Campylobacterota bacterium]
MAALKIEFDDKYYKSSDEIGDRTKEFIKALATNVFEASDAYRADGEIALPLLTDNEKHKYSTFAVAIDKITHTHYSEYAPNEGVNRTVDFWCRVEDRYDYYIELKAGSYNTGDGTADKPMKWVGSRIEEVIKQLKDIKKPGLVETEVRVGAVVINGFYHPSKRYDEDSLEGLKRYIAVHYAQEVTDMLIATWYLPDDLKKIIANDIGTEGAWYMNKFEWSTIVFFVV